MNQAQANGPAASRGAMGGFGAAQQQQQQLGQQTTRGGAPTQGRLQAVGPMGAAAGTRPVGPGGPALGGNQNAAAELLALLGKGAHGGGNPPGLSAAQQQQQSLGGGGGTHDALTTQQLQQHLQQALAGRGGASAGLPPDPAHAHPPNAWGTGAPSSGGAPGPSGSAFAAVVRGGGALGGLDLLAPSASGAPAPGTAAVGPGGSADGLAAHLSGMSLSDRLGALAGTAPAASASAASPEGYGLLGLLSVMQQPDRDIHTLALGSDLTGLGLSLSTPEPLHSAFAYPWGDPPTTREPVFALPQCYKMPQPGLKTGHLARFEHSTLFYMFYGMPRDILQAYAAQELYAREWKYHADLKLWFRREAAADLPKNLLSGAAAAVAAGGQGAVFVYWDVSSWEKRLYTGNAAGLVPGFLAEEEARVKAPGGGGGAGPAGSVP